MPLGFDCIELIGEKIRLRPIREDDTQHAYRFLTDDAILRWFSWDGPTNENEVTDVYRRWEAQVMTGEYYALAIECCDEPGQIGSIDIRFPRHPRQAEFGYWVGVPYWNRGYMTEAVRLACHFAFEYLDAITVSAIVFVGNTSSRRALEKNGFSLDGTLRQHAFKRGGFLDCWFLSLLRSEWEGNKDYYRPYREEVVAAGRD